MKPERRLAKWSIDEIRQHPIFVASGYILISTEYISNRTPLHFICLKGHNHFSTWSKFLGGQRCSECYGNRKLTIEEIKGALDKEGYKLIDSKYVECMQPMKLMCPKGHTWISSWNNFQSGYRCLDCSGIKRTTFDKIEKEANVRGYKVETTQEVINKKTELIFTCPKYHKFSMSWNSFRIHGCSNKECVEEKKRQTNTKLFGVPNTSMLAEFQDKAARSANNRQIKKHWKTEQDIICTGSYESAVVDCLNYYKIEYDWQPKVFQLSNYTYRPDLYLSSIDLWVEIKGRWIRNAKEKWKEFHTKFPNSEVWLLKDLKGFGFKHSVKNNKKLVFDPSTINTNFLKKLGQSND